MLTIDEVKSLLTDLESDRIERTISVREDKLGPAVCAFSNDYPNHKKSSYILIGVEDNGKVNGMKIGDDILQSIGNVRSNGNVLPQPSMIVSPVYSIDDGEVVVVEVQPSFYPPVRYKGNCHIRIGPRKALANEAEERRLSEKRSTTSRTFDSRACPGTTSSDINLDLIKTYYLPAAISPEILEANHRSIIEQISSLRLYDLPYNCPTNAGLILFGKNPQFHFPGAYIQFVKFDGASMSDHILFEKRFTGPHFNILKNLDDFIESSLIKSRPVRNGTMREDTLYNYPLWSLREFMMNALMHRDFESNAPVYIYEYTNRIEIVNPGGLFGEVRPENFPNISDYRNPVISEAMKTMGFVNKFNFGIRKAQQELLNAGNPEATFDFSLITKFKVTIYINPNW